MTSNWIMLNWYCDCKWFQKPQLLQNKADELLAGSDRAIKCHCIAAHQFPLHFQGLSKILVLKDLSGLGSDYFKGHFLSPVSTWTVRFLSLLQVPYTGVLNLFVPWLSLRVWRNLQAPSYKYIFKCIKYMDTYLLQRKPIMFKCSYQTLKITHV